jgi:hypothetical protein
MKRYALLLVGLAMMLVMATSALAAGPRITHFQDAGSFNDTSLCGFRLHVEYRQQTRIYEWFNANGDVRLFVAHGVFSEVVTAKGRTAYIDDRQKVVDRQGDTDLFVGSWVIRLPGGGVIRDAGRVEQLKDTGEIVDVSGPHPIAEQGIPADRFCTAFQP